jgi:hypothetical protein
MEFIVDFNDKLIKRMIFYKNASEETFSYKRFSLNKFSVQKVVLESGFKTNTAIKKKSILKKSIILQLMTNNKSRTSCKKVGDLKNKKKTIVNIKNRLSCKYSANFTKRWFFLLDPFFSGNEMISLSGSHSIKKNFDSFKTVQLLNSRIIISNFLNFEISLKFFFYQEGSSEIFFKNYDC